MCDIRSFYMELKCYGSNYFEIVVCILYSTGAISFWLPISEPLLGRCTVFHVVQILYFLQLLEFLVVAYVRVIGRQAHQIVDQAQDDQQARQRRQNEHCFGLFDAILAERFDLVLFADFHVLISETFREQEV